MGRNGPRIAYAGIVLPYDLVNLNRFTITTSLIPARDTVLGIMLGIFAMWLIFDHLWVKTSTDSMRKLFLSTFREIGQRKVSAKSVSTGAQSRHLLGQCERINAHLDKVRSLADLAVFEPYSKAADEAYLGESTRMLLPQLLCFLLLKAGLLQHQLISEPSEVERLTFAVQQRASSILLDTARILESGRRAVTLDAEDTLSVTAADASQDNPALRVQVLLNSSLINVAKHLRDDSLLLLGSKDEPADHANLLLDDKT